MKNKVMKLGEGGNGVASGRESKAGTGPTPAGVGGRQGRAAKFVTTNFERLTESLTPRSKYLDNPIKKSTLESLEIPTQPV